nr:glycosyltransferase family 4 protein [Pelomicrobium methylotrophicum]
MPDNRRVLLIASSLQAGGAERMISQMANAWAARGRQVAVLTLSGTTADHYVLHPAVERIGLDLLRDSHSLWEAVRWNMRRSQAIQRAVRRWRPDVVISFIVQMNVTVLVALAGSRIPVIVSERTDPRRHAVGRAWRLARRLLYPAAARLVVQTESVARWAVGIVPGRRVRVVPNFVRELPPAAYTGRATDELLAVGRLDQEKGFDLLLRAFAASEFARAGARLVILGEGPERRALETLAQELSIAERILLPGVVRDPETWMARCTAFVLPSRYEGFPNVLLEAMAMGCPVIAADCDSGPREIIKHGENGLLVPPEDVDALAQALDRLWRDAALRARLGAAAVEVRERFSKERVLALWEQMIEEVLTDD